MTKIPNELTGLPSQAQVAALLTLGWTHKEEGAHLYSGQFLTTMITCSACGTAFRPEEGRSGQSDTRFDVFCPNCGEGVTLICRSEYPNTPPFDFVSKSVASCQADPVRTASTGFYR